MKIERRINQIRLRFCTIILLLFGTLTFASAQSPVIVINTGYRLLINSNNGAIESFTATIGGGNDELLIPNQGNLPLFKVEFMDSDSKFQDINSSQAKKVTVTKRRYLLSVPYTPEI